MALQSLIALAGGMIVLGLAAVEYLKGLEEKRKKVPIKVRVNDPPKTK